MTLRRNDKRQEKAQAPVVATPPNAVVACEETHASPVAPFVLGTVIGGLAGAVLGTALSPHTRGFLVGLYHLISRRLSSSERDQLRFELLLQ